MGLLVTCLLGIALTAARADEYGSYPTQYPFESDSYGDLEASELLVLHDTGIPDFTFGDEDTGGYYLHGGILKSMDDQSGVVDGVAGVFSSIGGMDYPYFCESLGMGLWTLRLMELPVSSWNCTARGNQYSKANFPGTQNGDTICTDCCTEFYDQWMFGDGTDERQQLFADFVAANGCATMTEPVYCSTGDSWHWVCIEGYVTREERLFQKNCYDGFVYHMTECSLLKVAGVHDYLESIFAEPKNYIDTLANFETFVIYSIEYTTFDRVCLPYSYYYPDAASDEDDSSASTVSLLFGSALIHIVS